MSYKIFIFDLDNTLVASKPHALHAHNKVAEAMGRKGVTEKELNQSLHLTWVNFIKTLWPGIDPIEFQKKYSELDLDKVSVPLIEGALEVLDLLRIKNLPIGILTNRTRASLLGGLVQSGLRKNHFDFLESLDDFIHPKPDPRAFDRLKKKIKPSDMVYVGDAVIDFESAKGAEINFFAVLTGASEAKDFLAAGLSQERIFPSIKNILEFI